MGIVNTIIGIMLLFLGIGLGIWFANFTEIIDLKNQNAQLKAKVDKLEALVDYYENK